MHPNHHHGAAASGPAPHGAAPAGLSQPPTSDNARLQAGEVERQGTADNADCAGQARQAQGPSFTDKTRATLAALLALKGYSLHEVADGSYLASRWNHARPLRDLHAVQAFARQVGAA